MLLVLHPISVLATSPYSLSDISGLSKEAYVEGDLFLSFDSGRDQLQEISNSMLLGKPGPAVACQTLGSLEPFLLVQKLDIEKASSNHIVISSEEGFLQVKITYDPK